MPITLDLTDDFASVVDNLVSATVVWPGTSVAVTQALRREVSRREVESSKGLVFQGDLLWNLPKSEVATRPPLGAKIVDSDGAKWTVLDVRDSTITDRWRIITRNLAFQNRLDALVTIQKATWSKATGGAASASWSDHLRRVPARIQPQETEVKVEHNAHAEVTTHRIILSEEITELKSSEASRDYRVKDQADEVYKIVGYEQSERIDVLPVLLARKTPWPFA